MRKQGLSIGQVSERTGLATSAIRYYETEGLVLPWRNAGGQRQFERSDIRKLSFVMVAQRLGFTLPEIRKELDRLPRNRPPSRDDWARIGAEFRAQLDRRIATLERLRDTLDGCIGCGCLSLDVCGLYNPGDKAGRDGAGPRYLLKDRSEPDSR